MTPNAGRRVFVVPQLPCSSPERVLANPLLSPNPVREKELHAIIRMIALPKDGNGFVLGEFPEGCVRAMPRYTPKCKNSAAATPFSSHKKPPKQAVDLREGRMFAITTFSSFH